ncbi:class I SAM-dependent methyltransferase [Poritiphilus flavus]|uniref:Methyltransferase domain-containing protein n=1 Tax=Poritiphilus flavus TaxID=2697053 RepID=A0A6L9EI98_9FLAO|nr:class I SAM-dependent methyltransferase [Poritiphilus flavus]NAS14471.1 methyltransferase domain-containing protein [Poritiphilus flavus]
MATDYNTIAKEYQASKMQPWRKHIEGFSLFELAGDLSGKTVLDLACGEGFYTRQLKLRGAPAVEGVDISETMIQLARKAENQSPLGIVYHEQDVLNLKLNKKFDLITASYLLNYAKTAEELLQFGKAISDHLNPGGRFVTINSNPDYKAPIDTLYKYGFTREDKSHSEGAEIIYRFFDPDGSNIEVINYHLEKSTHETALKKAGLSNIHWHNVQLSPEGKEAFGMDYWKPILETQPVIGLSCNK